MVEVVDVITRSARMAVKVVAVDSVPREKVAGARKGRVAMARMAAGLMRQEAPGPKVRAAMVVPVRKGKAAKAVPALKVRGQEARAPREVLVLRVTAPLSPRVKTAKTFSYKRQGLTLTAPGLFI